MEGKIKKMNLSLSLSHSQCIFTRNIILRDKQIMIIEFSLIYTFSAPQRSCGFYAHVYLKLTMGRHRRSLKYNNEDISYQNAH